MVDGPVDRNLFDQADSSRADADGFAFRAVRASVHVSRRTRILARMGLVMALLAVIVAAALYGLGLIVKLRLDRVFVG